MLPFPKYYEINHVDTKKELTKQIINNFVVTKC